ncbi:MAG: hypothetical protein CVU47_06830 [Chloroflexi bacterium HGW-Chloroflexi-9]|nr:MAG: hypothetical protein CVU47_06830 [Chloroflexi bacterium HGW-Chloroflexi-9]
MADSPETSRITGLLVGLPADVVQDGARWLHQQCWLWGRDLRSPQGNLLVRYGFRRLGPPEAQSGGHRTRYGMTTAEGRHVVVWSGGYALGDDSDVLCFPRLRFQPVVLEPGVAAPEDVPVILGPPEASGPAPVEHLVLRLLAPALDWLAGYEAHVARVAPGHRAACAVEWDRVEHEAVRLAAGEGIEYHALAGISPDGLASSWRSLAARVRATA